MPVVDAGSCAGHIPRMTELTTVDQIPLLSADEQAAEWTKALGAY